MPLLAACEDTPEFTEPEEVAFTAVAIDKATVLPREGSRLTVGPTEQEVEFDVHWQNMPANSVLGVWLETHDSASGETFVWEGDLSGSFELLDTGTGQTSFAGTFTLPEVSPFCGSYDYLRILAVVFPGGESPPNAAYRDEVFYEVSGSDWTGPCVSDIWSEFPGTTYAIGEPIVVYGRDLPDALAVSLPGSQQDDNTWPRFIRPAENVSIYPVPNDGYIIGFIPLGAESGRLRAFAGSTEVRYGPDGVVSLPVSTSTADVFEPNNTVEQAADLIYFDFWDTLSTWGAYGYNPSLTLTGADRTPDAVAPEYGEGDWFWVLGEGEAGTLIDVCINIASHAGDLDDIDLLVYDAAGAIAAESATPSGAEGVRIDDLASGEAYFAWVAPWLDGMNTALGGYRYEVGHCANATGTEIARPGEPLGVAGAAAGVRTVARPATQERPSARQPGSRVAPPSVLRQRGGGR